MRQGQQNRRGRGRNNRKSQNPLTRSFESNGPDVKIRGTPAHIAEKYVSLARDALSSGDRVLAENYLQHAEHYNRIIMAYREQQSQFGEGQQGQQNRQRDTSEYGDGDDGDSFGEEGYESQGEGVPRGHEPQPSMGDGDEQQGSGRRANGASHGGGRGDGGGRGEGRRRREAAPSDAANDGEAPGGKSDESSGGERRGSGSRRRERYAQRDDQPDFLRRPIRKPRRTSSDDDEQSGDDAFDGAVADNTSA